MSLSKTCRQGSLLFACANATKGLLLLSLLALLPELELPLQPANAITRHAVDKPRKDRFIVCYYGFACKALRCKDGATHRKTVNMALRAVNMGFARKQVNVV